MKNYIILLSILLCIAGKGAAQTAPDPAHDKSWKDSIFHEEFNYSDFTDLRLNGLFPQGSSWFLNVWGDHHDVLNTHEKVYWAFDNTDTTMLFHPDASGTNPDSSYMRFYFKKKNETVGSVVYNYITTVLSTATGSGWKYGYIEMSYRLPDWTATKWDVHGNPIKTSLAGFSNAFWMFNQDKIHGITNSEIDIFEDYNGFNQMEPNMHYRDSLTMGGSYNGSDSAASRALPRVTFSNTWHTISVDWAPDYVHTYCDGVLSMITKKYSDSLLQMGLILGESINAYYTNNGFADSTEYADVHTHFPYYMDINHIKVWKLNMDSCSGSPTVLNKFDPATYSPGVKKSIEITGNTMTDITPGQHVSLRASDYIRIDKNFKAEIGSTFEMLPAKCQP